MHLMRSVCGISALLVGLGCSEDAPPSGSDAPAGVDAGNVGDASAHVDSDRAVDGGADSSRDGSGQDGPFRDDGASGFGGGSGTAPDGGSPGLSGEAGLARSRDGGPGPSDGAMQSADGPDGSGGPDTGDAARASPPGFVTAEEGDALRGFIDNLTVNGDFCPPIAYAIAIVPSRITAGISFATMIGGEAQGIALACTVEADIGVPEGYEITRVPVRLAGYSVKAMLTRTYEFNQTGEPRRLLDSFEDDFIIGDWAELPVVPSCAPSRRVHLKVVLEPAVSTDDSVFQMDSLDFSTVWRDGADWRRCGEVEPLQMLPGKVGEFCSGLHQRACAEGLACERRGLLMPSTEGACVNPNEALPPQGTGQACGGVRSIACESGLLCWFTSQDAIDQGALGQCAPAIGGEGDICNLGVPSLACSSGYYCEADGHRCVTANGEEGSWCGEGLPDCNTGLRCAVSRCVTPRSRADAAP